MFDEEQKIQQLEELIKDANGIFDDEFKTRCLKWLEELKEEMDRVVKELEIMMNTDLRK